MSFEDLFGAAPGTRADAPGRVNLIGEHTDYHHGFVLPTAIPQRTTIELARRSDDCVRAWSTMTATDGVVEYRIGSETPGRGWLDYLQGVTKTVASSGLSIAGFDARIESTVPVGSGLSSSAALEISILRALRRAFNLPLTDIEIAQLGQRAEVEFVGAPVGIMDQMVASLATGGEALFLDTRSLDFERVAVPSDIELLVIDSGITHKHAGGDYVRRRRESFAAAAELGVERLRELSVADLPRINALPPLLARRARHVVAENQRVLDAVAALRGGDVERLGMLVNASHTSMRDDYEVSTPEIDTLVAIGAHDSDVLGARLTGGGFGGAVVMLARAGASRSAATRIIDRYRAATGRTATRLLPLQ